MKLTLFFAAIDLLILLLYTISYIMHNIRKMMGLKH